MRIAYDNESNALYNYLIEGQEQCRTVRLTEAIALDFGKAEKLVGIEILGAKRSLVKRDCRTS